MSFEQSTYIGTFFTFVPHATSEETYEETRCTNSECVNHTKEMKEGVKFCPECGSKVDWVDVVEEEIKTADDYINEEYQGQYFHDYFYCPEYFDMVLTGNYDSFDIPEGAELIIANGTYDEDDPMSIEFLKRLGEYETHYGLVQYQS